MIEETAPNNSGLVILTSEIVSVYVSHNSLGAGDLPVLISAVHEALKGLEMVAPIEVAPVQKPAVPIKKSVTSDFIVCLEDGLKFKSLKRHLMTHFQMTPDDYRTKWNLPRDYPMVAASYAAVRSSLAKTAGLGRKTPSGSAAKQVRPRAKKAL